MHARKMHFSRISSSVSCLGYHDMNDYYIHLVKQLLDEIQVLDWQLGDIFRNLRETRLKKKKKEGKIIFKQWLILINAEIFMDEKDVT